MAKRIVLEIDDALIRGAEVTYAASSAKIVRFFTIPLTEGVPLSNQVDTVRQALQQQGLAKADADVIVSRRAVEIREMTAPPVPNNELPDLLKFVARNEFASFTDQWPFDFVPYSEDETVERKVLATALRSAVFAEITKLAEGAGLRVRRLLLRPFCQAAAIERHVLPTGVTLFAQRIDKNLDILILRDGLIRSARSVLLAGHDNQELDREAVAEIERTAILAPQSLAADALDRIVLLGSIGNPAMRGKLERLGQIQVLSAAELSVPNVTLPRERPEVLEQATALIGAAGSLLDTRRRQIDFINPRRPEVKRIDKKRLALWGAASAALVLLLVGFGWYLVAQEKRAIAQLTEELNSLKAVTEPANQPSAAQRIAEVAVVDNWMAENVNWLEEFAQLSQRLETGDDVVLNSINARIGKETVTSPGADRQSIASISLTGNVKSLVAKAAVEKSLAERPYQVEPFKLSIDSNNSEYPNKIEGQITKALDVSATTREIQERIIRKALESLPKETPTSQTAELPK